MQTLILNAQNVRVSEFYLLDYFIHDAVASVPVPPPHHFRIIFDTNLNSTMVVFLDCLQQFAGEVEGRHRFSLPNEMDMGKVVVVEMQTGLIVHVRRPEGGG